MENLIFYQEILPTRPVGPFQMHFFWNLQFDTLSIDTVIYTPNTNWSGNFEWFYKTYN